MLMYSREFLLVRKPILASVGALHSCDGCLIYFYTKALANQNDAPMCECSESVLMKYHHYKT